jgi:RecA/RadA recombinase
MSSHSSSHSSQKTLLHPQLEIKTALEQYCKQGSSLKMTTGAAELDSLIDGIEEGLLYLFYGDASPLDALSHRLLVNCILPVKLRHGFESMAVCFNNTDYSGSRKLVLNPETIANTAKVGGIDPMIVSKNLYIQTAYTSTHQVQVAKEIANLLEENSNIKLIVINNFTKFFKDSREERRLEIANELKQVIAVIWRACAKNRAAVIVTGDANLSSKGIIPRPIGGVFLKHVANTIVHIRDMSVSSSIPRFKATLVKHQYLKTPKSTIIHAKKCGKSMMLP